MKIFNWLKESNRILHLKFGFVIWIILMFLSVGCLLCLESLVGITQMQTTAIVITCAFICDSAVFIAMCAVKYIQKAAGIGKWDWLDILAGCLISLICTLVMFIVVI